MAVHFLDHEFALMDRTAGQPHTLELFESGGQRYIRLWLGGIGQNKPIEMLLDKKQAQAIAEAAESLAARISD